MMGTTYAVVLAVYMAGMVFLGWYFSRMVKDTSSYYTTARSTNAAVTGFSYSATQMSAGTVIGSPATVWKLGYNYIPVSIASTAAPWFTFLSIGERMRRIAERINAYTYGDIFEARYGRAARYFYAALMLVFYIPLMVGQLKACGDILKVALGWDYLIGVIFSGVIIVIYTWTGGMFAVAWSDLFQGLVMVIGLIILSALVLGKAGGMAAVHTGLAAIDPKLIRLTGLVTATWAVCNVITWSFLQIGGSAAAVVRFIIPKDMKTLRTALGYSMVFQTVTYVTVGIVGLAGRVLLPDLKVADTLVPTLATQMLHPLLGGIVLSAILAAIMSTVDSVLLLCSAAATRDLYVPLINPKATDVQQLNVGRLATVALGVIPMILAIRPIDAVQWLVAFSFNVMAASLTVPILCTAWWPRANKHGAAAAMYSGLASSLYWYYLGWQQFKSLSNWPYGIWPGVIGTAVSLVFMVVITMVTPAPDEGINEVFYRT
ncbi:MAG: sodium/proline symporter [Ignavibacteriales bacterium]